MLLGDIDDVAGMDVARVFVGDNATEMLFDLGYGSGNRSRVIDLDVDRRLRRTDSRGTQPNGHERLDHSQL